MGFAPADHRGSTTSTVRPPGRSVSTSWSFMGSSQPWRSLPRMRFFSRGWADGDLSEHEADRATAEYAARLDDIWVRLPTSMRKLAREVFLHDAVIGRIVWTPASRNLVLVLLAGTSERGYQGSR